MTTQSTTDMRAVCVAVLTVLAGVVLAVVLFGPSAPAGDQPVPVPTTQPGPPVPTE